jgi:hypothetical protein
MEVENRAKNDLIKSSDREVRFVPRAPARIGRGELRRNEWWITSCEGMKRYGISLGSVENGVYFRKEKEGMFLLQRA